MQSLFFWLAEHRPPSTQQLLSQYTTDSHRNGDLGVQSSAGLQRLNWVNILYQQRLVCYRHSIA